MHQEIFTFININGSNVVSKFKSQLLKDLYQLPNIFSLQEIKDISHLENIISTKLVCLLVTRHILYCILDYKMQSRNICHNLFKYVRNTLYRS